MSEAIKESKIKQPEVRDILRSSINFANYNPRKISPEARKKLKANLKRVGLMGGIVWNENTGNLVSGHQRVSIIDEVNHYNAETKENDYTIRVEVAQFDEKTEKEQNLFFNNRSVQGEFDDEMLRQMLDGIDYDLAGFDDFDLSLMGIGEADTLPEFTADAWTKESVIGVDSEEGEEPSQRDEYLAAIDDMTSESGENTKIDRSTDFYNDSAENQIARHNEVQKIKDRIGKQNDINKDGGMLSYVVLSFKTPTERMQFMEMFGYGMEDRYIDGTEFMNRVEFGIEEENE